jgi:glycosyltransferase involved in cell wall biosynthesis
MSNEDAKRNSRARIALITNHGYAGTDIPVGGAPDTGGQNYYVNALADAFDQAGFDVTIFTRGGFPFFESGRMREGIEKMSDHVRYVYVPGGGDTFLRKEDIGIALDEEVLWMERFIAEEARARGVLPWEYYEIINTHYWDAGIIAVKLVERWQDTVVFDFLTKTANGVFAPELVQYAGEERHRLSLSRELFLHLGEMAKNVTESDDPQEVIQQLTGTDVTIDATCELGSDKCDFLESIFIGNALIPRLHHDGVDLKTSLNRVDTHVWTPHSLAIIKERNFWGKDPQIVRSLKFRERDAHEQVVSNRTPLFCATSPEIWRAMVAYHGLNPETIFDFPPCIDGRAFHPRSETELTEVHAFLSRVSGISVERLTSSLIVFETSRMDTTKRKDLLLGAFSEIADHRDDVFLFIGGGPVESPVYKSLKAQIESTPGLRGRAFLLGFVSEEMVEPLFSAADLFVSASEMEGFGMSVSQAAAAGVAIVSSDLIPFATQYSKDAAVVVPAGYQHGFAEAMDRLLSDGEERSRRAKQLLEVAAEFDWVATAKRFINWYHEKKRLLPSIRTSSYPDSPKW